MHCPTGPADSPGSGEAEPRWPGFAGSRAGYRLVALHNKESGKIVGNCRPGRFGNLVQAGKVLLAAADSTDPAVEMDNKLGLYLAAVTSSNKA